MKNDPSTRAQMQALEGSTQWALATGTASARADHYKGYPLA
jgi:hypothetical protein